MSCGRNAKTPNIAAPKSSDTRLVVQTAGRRIIRMSMSGSAERSSVTIQPAKKITARANNPRVRPEDHPQVAPLLSGSSRVTSQPARSTAENQLIRPRAPAGEGGTTRQAATATRVTAIIGIQNSQRQSSQPTIGPARTMPRPLPLAMTAARMPIAEETRFGG